MSICLYIFVYPCVYIYRYIHRYSIFTESVFLMCLVWYLDCLVIYSWWMTVLIIHHWWLVYWYYHSGIGLQLTGQLRMVKLPAWSSSCRTVLIWRLKTMFVQKKELLHLQIDHLCIYEYLLYTSFFLNRFIFNINSHHSLYHEGW